jgi:ribonuclease III
MNEPVNSLDDLQVCLGYRFHDVNALVAALTHASAVQTPHPRVSERLEFLGDAVLGLVLSELLVARYPEYNEGRLSKCRASLVNTASFAAKARELGLDVHVTLGKGEEKTGGRAKVSILAAAYEAVMGAIFIESGYSIARDVVAVHFHHAIEALQGVGTTDPKTELQELCQDRFRMTPVYRVVEESGPHHARRFVVDVRLGENALARGEGGSKRHAEQEAAQRALQLLTQRTEESSVVTG